MSYKKAIHILPEELLELIQEYVDGECIYIPRKSNNKKNGEVIHLLVRSCQLEICRFTKTIKLDMICNIYRKSIIYL